MQATHIECPVCRAKPGESCRTINGKAMLECHTKRKLATLAKALQPRENGVTETLP